MPTIKFNLSEGSINEALKQLREYQKKVELAGQEIAKRLGQMGFNVAYGIMQGHVFSGETAESLRLIDEGDGKYTLTAGSQALLFFEFGAGIRYGGGHPWDDDFGYGPGTYPGNGHWDDPYGWWFPTEDPRLIIRVDKNGQGWGHSYGNKPHMPFYLASKEMRDKLLEVARKVFRE